MLSHTSQYALRAVLYLAEEAIEKPMRVEDVAAALEVPRNYLSKILHVLAREGVLASVRGPHGGFQLGTSPEELTLAAVVDLFEPQPVGAERRCLLGRSDCSDLDPCPAHDRWMEVSAEVREFFEGTTVADFHETGSVLPPRT